MTLWWCEAMHVSQMSLTVVHHVFQPITGFLPSSDPGRARARAGSTKSSRFASGVIAAFGAAAPWSKAQLCSTDGGESFYQSTNVPSGNAHLQSKIPLDLRGIRCITPLELRGIWAI